MGLQEIEEEIKRLNQKLEQGAVEKKWRFPFGKKVSGGQRKKGLVTVLIIKGNGTYIFKKYKVEDLTIMHELIPRLATYNYIIYDSKGNPLIILPEYSVVPIDFKKLYDTVEQNKTTVTAFKILLSKMLSNQVEKKGLGGWGKWIGLAAGLGLLALIGYAILTGGGG